MKKKLLKKKLLLIMSVLVSLRLFCACSNNEENDVLSSIKQIEIDSGTRDFLSTELPVSSYIHWSYGFFQEIYTDTCLIINSNEELQRIYDESVSKLPELAIDFKRNTLVVGQHRIYERFTLPKKLERLIMYEKADNYTLQVYYQKGDNDVDFGIPKLAYYWGVYPKLKDKKVVVNIIGI